MTEAVQSCFARCEKKYMLTRSQCDALMARIDAHLKEDRYPIYTICNIYYDTDDYRLIRASLKSRSIRKSCGCAAMVYRVKQTASL